MIDLLANGVVERYGSVIVSAPLLRSADTPGAVLVAQRRAPFDARCCSPARPH
jgi:hypothetical protein